MEILAIGNSFSMDAARYVHQIGRTEGVNVNVTNLYIGGCSLERHYRNMLTGQRAYALQYNGEETRFPVSLEEALSNRKWDVVITQQVSAESFLPDTYRPYLAVLTDMIREYAPKAKFCLHETWFYEAGSPKLLETAGFPTEDAMLEKIQAAYAENAAEVGADGVIPSGTLFGMLRKAGIAHLHRDTYHASFGIGRYALSLLWYCYFTGRDVPDTILPDPDAPISQEEYAIAKECVRALLA